MFATVRDFLTRFFGNDEVELRFAAPPPTTDQGERQHYFTHAEASPRPDATTGRDAATQDVVRARELQGASRR